jgi:hypothetical protein
MGFHPLSRSKLTELSAQTRLTRPSFPLWIYFSTSYAMGWNRVQTALAIRLNVQLECLPLTPS